MNEFISHVQLIALYLLNGALALSYVIWEQLTPIATGIAFVMLGWRAPRPQRGWIAGSGGGAGVAGPSAGRRQAGGDDCAGEDTGTNTTNTSLW